MSHMLKTETEPCGSAGFGIRYIDCRCDNWCSSAVSVDVYVSPFPSRNLINAATGYYALIIWDMN